MRRRGLFLVVLIVVGCRATLGIHDPEIAPDGIESGTPDGQGSEGGPSDGGGDADLDVVVVDDGAVHPTQMIQIPRAAGDFFIDVHEVTQAQYADFLANGPAPTPAKLPPFCDDNTSFVPLKTFTPVGTPNLPVVGVTWCDASVYCKWVGKRLCGGMDGASGAYADLANPLKNDWLYACTKGAAQAYSYGTTERKAACNVNSGDGGGKLFDVGAKPNCEGAYPGLFDMIGNATEWSSMCEPIDSGLCGIMGGSFSFPGSGSVQCSTTTATQRNAAFDDLGFRCCASM